MYQAAQIKNVVVKLNLKNSYGLQNEKPLLEGLQAYWHEEKKRKEGS